MLHEHFLHYLSSMRVPFSITITITIMIIFYRMHMINTFQWDLLIDELCPSDGNQRQYLELKIYNGWSHHGSPSITEWKEGKLGQVSPMNYIPGEPSKWCHRIKRGRVWLQKPKFQKKFRHMHGDLNLDEIKNALRLLSVNGETNLMNITRL